MDAGPILSDSNETELPYGYKFRPNAFEILEYYLVQKLKGGELPSNDIKDLDVYQYDPHELPLNESKYSREDEAYFFVPVTIGLLQGGDNLTRTTPSGYWKSFKENVSIYSPDGRVIGYKNKLEFYHGQNPDGSKTDWQMVEYRTNFRDSGNVESLMVCKVRLKVEVELVEVYDEEDEEEGGTNGDT